MELIEELERSSAERKKRAKNMAKGKDRALEACYLIKELMKGKEEERAKEGEETAVEMEETVAFMELFEKMGAEKNGEESPESRGRATGEQPAGERELEVVQGEGLETARGDAELEESGEGEGEVSDRDNQDCRRRLRGDVGRVVRARSRVRRVEDEFR